MSFENPTNIDSKIEFPEVNLKIEEPARGGIIFSFDAKTEEEARLYNEAIQVVFNKLEESGYDVPIHNEADGTPVGPHNWEIWNLTKDEANEILPTIKDIAKQIFELEHKMIS